MHKIKKIAWESWNSKVEESLSDNALSEVSVSLLEDSDDEYPLLAHDLTEVRREALRQLSEPFEEESDKVEDAIKV